MWFSDVTFIGLYEASSKQWHKYTLMVVSRRAQKSFNNKIWGGLQR